MKSLTGQDDWEWNRLQAKQRALAHTRESPTYQLTDRSTSRRRCRHPTPDDVEKLQTELERKEQQLDYVLWHYELILADKNRKLANRRKAEPDSNRVPAVLSTFRRWIFDR